MHRVVAGIAVIFAASAVTAGAAEMSFCPLRGFRVATTIDSIHEQRWQHVTRQSRDISCGSAALATILNYQFGDEISEQQLIESILKRVAEKDVAKRGGFTLLDLKRVAVDLGYKVHGYKLSMEQLGKLNAPALVPLTIRGYKHFVVFCGMVGDRAILADPSFGNTVMPAFEFEKVWQGVALVAVRDASRPVPAKLMIRVHDAQQPTTPADALRTFIQRGETFQAVDPNEF